MREFTKHPSPPKVAEWILQKIICKDMRYAALGDFEEIFISIVEEQSHFRAWLWYWGQVIKSLPSFLFDLIFWNFVMFKSYLKVAYRNLKKRKVYSFINITGLATGMASCFLILLWVQDELSYDRFHTNSANLYRIESTENFSEGKKYHTQMSPVGLAPLLSEQVPEVTHASRCTRFGGIHLRYKDNIYYENNIRAVDPDFFQMFDFQLIKGGPNNLLSDSYKIVLTEKTAEKYFGDENPIGKVITIENKFDLFVTGIIKEAPGNSSIKFDGLVRFDFTNDQLERMPGGWGNAITTFVLLQENSPLSDVGEKISNLVHTFSEKSKSDYSLNPLTRIHLHFTFGSDQSIGYVRYVYIFSTIAIFVLLIACINFMNLSTARSENRAKEIGMRKVVGANRKNIIAQFFGESLLLALLALCIAVVLIIILLPVFNSISGKSLEFSVLGSRTFIIGIIAITLFTGLVSGSYPALVLSTFKPVRVLQGSKVRISKRSPLRKTLVVIQFALSIFLIIGTAVVYNQLNYMKNRNLGFDKDNLLCIRMTGETPLSYPTIKNELIKHTNILGITASGRKPSITGDTGRNINWDGKDPNKHVKVVFHTIDYDYPEHLKIEMAEGRSYSKKFPSDTSGAFVINEELAKLMGPGSPIGKNFSIFWMKGKIIGVMKNYNHLPLHANIEPMVFLHPPNPYWLSTVLVKIQPGNIESTLEFIEKTWKKIVPDYPFDYSFLDEDYDRMYRVEKRLGRLLNYFAFLAVLIACLGLFGLASFTTEQRTKEIGIRKTLGASAAKIVMMLSAEFVKWVALANLIAWPVAWVITTNWLNDFAYSSKLRVEIFFLAGILAMFIALLTVSYQAYKAAVTNPVDALKYE
jgi:putative ABC transport system permease protein